MPDGDTTTTVGDLSFYDHHRQRYGHLPLRDGFREFHVGDYGPANEPNHGVGEGGELSIILHRFNDGRLHPELRVFADAYGSLRALIDNGTLDLIEKSEIETADDLTAILLGAGLRDRSDFREPLRTCQTCHGAGQVPPEDR